MKHANVLLMTTLGACVTTQAPPGPDLQAEERALREEVLAMLASATPSAPAFHDALSRLARWPHGPLRPETVRAIDEALASWPDEVRRVPTAWHRANGPPRPELGALARHLDTRELTRPLTKALGAPHLHAVTFVSLRGEDALRVLLEVWGSRTLTGLVGEGVGQGGLGRLCGWEGRTRLETLSLWDNGLGSGLGDAIAKAGPWPALKRLDLGANKLGDAGIAGLSKASMPRLRTLALDWNGLEGASLQALLGVPERATLRTLKLANNALTPKAVGLLAALPTLAGVEVMSLGSNPMGDAGMEALASGPRGWPALRRLTVSKTSLGVAGCAPLGRLVAPLEFLDVSDNALTDACVPKLASAPYLKTIRSLMMHRTELTELPRTLLALPWHKLAALGLRGNALGTTDCAALAADERLSGLTALALDNNKVGDACARALAGAGTMARLDTLTLSHAGIGDAGAQAIGASPHLRGLRTLKLGWNEFKADGARSLSKLRGLRILSVEGNTIGDTGVQALLGLPELRTLDLGWTAMTNQGLAAVLGAPQTWAELELQGNAFEGPIVARFANAQHISQEVRARFAAKYLRER